MSNDPSIIRTEPLHTIRRNGRAVAAHDADEDGEPRENAASTTEAWEKWVHKTVHETLDNERAVMIPCFKKMLRQYVHALLDEIEPQLKKIGALELKLAEMTGALDVLRSGGRLMRVRGTYDAGAADSYKLFDVVATNGSSFIALEDKPGRCPGPGWQLLASCGSRGRIGPKGERGAPGLSARAPTATGIRGMHVNPQNFMLSVYTADRQMHQVSLLSLFKAFYAQVTRGS